MKHIKRYLKKYKKYMKPKSPYVKQIILERTLAKRKMEKEERSYVEIEPNVFIKKWGH